jgi:hypothetical protein
MNLDVHFKSFTNMVQESWNHLQENVNEEQSALKLIAYSCIPIVGPILLHNKTVTHKAEAEVSRDVHDITVLNDLSMKSTFIFAGAVAIQALAVFLFLAIALSIPWLVPLGEAVIFIGLGIYTSHETTWLEKQPRISETS